MRRTNKISVTKSSGKLAPYSQKRLKTSLRKAGATSSSADKIAGEIEASLYDGMSTEEIFERAFLGLRPQPGAAAARYKLKKAIMELGPTGFPFEQYMAKLLQEQGYRTETGKMVQGACVRHEVDVVGRRGDEYLLMECKYHSQPGVRCDVKVPLYIDSRFRDIRGALSNIPGFQDLITIGWVATNTQFTLDAINYGRCAGLKLIGWDYPEGDGLKDLIDKTGLYPITSLTTITQAEKQKLLAANIVLCRDLMHDNRKLNHFVTSKQRHERIIEECRDLCGYMAKSETR